MSGPTRDNTLKTTSLSSDRLSAETDRPWKDTKLSEEDRYKSYLEVATQKCKEIAETHNRLKAAGELGNEIKRLVWENEESKFWISELEKLSKESPAEFCERISYTPTGSYAELPDNRLGFKPHRAYLFLVEPSEGTVLEELKSLCEQRVKIVF